VVFVTPLPVSTAQADFAGIMREVALEAGVPVIEARAYVEGRADWWAVATDGVHPNSAGYAALAPDVLLPALAPVVDARLLSCQGASARSA